MYIFSVFHKFSFFSFYFLVDCLRYGLRKDKYRKNCLIVCIKADKKNFPKTEKFFDVDNR